MRITASSSAAAFAACLMLAAPTASAQVRPGPEAGAGSVLRQGGNDALEWKFRRFGGGEYAATGALVGTMLGIELLSPKSSGIEWRGGVLMDDFVRDGLREETQAGRDKAGAASDVLLWSLMAAPMLDAGLTAGVAHGNSDVAWQMAMINAQSYAVSGLAQQVTKRVFKRARPYEQNCGVDPTQTDCEEDGSKNESMISGHAAMAFTAAGLMCAHHENLPLYGGGTADDLACGIALGAATATGALRIAADKHYVSDVVAGAAVGLVSGYLLPKWLHYDKPKGEVSDTYVAPAAGEFTGVQFGGRF